MAFTGQWWGREKISKVTKEGDWYEVGSGNGVFALEAKYGVEPKVGDIVELYSDTGPWRPIEGVKINDAIVFQNSDEQIEANHQEWIKKNAEEKKQKFEQHKAELDKTYESLPPEFRARIDRFRAKREGFRVSHEAYEMFCCEDAVKMANTLKTVEKLREYRDAKNEDQKKMVPDVDYVNHSGNTFGAACLLADLYLKAPKMVKYFHGSLATLTGCEEYGCHPMTKEEEDDVNSLVAEYKLE